MCGYVSGKLSEQEKRERLALNLIKNIKPDADSKMAKAVAIAAQMVLDGKVN